jgi:hypothetical protein
MTGTTEEELRVLATKAGLDALPAAYRAELLSAYRHLEVMLARVAQDRPHGDEPAHVFNAATFARKG